MNIDFLYSYAWTIWSILAMLVIVFSGKYRLAATALALISGFATVIFFIAPTLTTFSPLQYYAGVVVSVLLWVGLKLLLDHFRKRAA